MNDELIYFVISLWRLRNTTLNSSFFGNILDAIIKSLSSWMMLDKSGSSDILVS